MAKEEWRPVDGWSDYEVSNTGNVRSVDRLVKPQGRRAFACKGRILKQSVMKKGNQHVVCLSNGRGDRKTVAVARLVGLAFLPGRGDRVRHKDGDTANNA